MSVPAAFKAATLGGVGEKHIVGPRSLAPLEPGEVAIKVTATAINPVDWKIRDTGFFIESWPTIIGSDAAGEVAALGPGVSGLAVGNRVFFEGILGQSESCTFQQYCKMPADLLCKTPSSIADEQAAGIALANVAAVVSLYDKSGRGLPAPWNDGGDKAGEGRALVILGGATSVGQYAIQWARLSGYERIVTTASPKHRTHLTSLGAHEVLDRHHATPEAISKVLGGVPLDVVLDGPSIKETQVQAVEVVRATGSRDRQVITLSAIDDDVKMFSETGEIPVPVRLVMGVAWDPKLAYLSKPMVKHLGGEDGLVAKGVIAPNRVSVVAGGLAGLEEAMERVKTGVSGEKIVIRPWDE